MKLISSLALAAALSVAAIGAAMAQAPAAPAAKAAAPAAGKVSTASTVGALLDNPAAKKVLEANVPDVVKNPMIEQARDMAFKELSQFEPALTPDMLAKIDADLGKL